MEDLDGKVVGVMLEPPWTLRRRCCVSLSIKVFRNHVDRNENSQLVMSASEENDRLSLAVVSFTGSLLITNVT